MCSSDRDECEVEISLEELDAARDLVRQAVKFPIKVAKKVRKLGSRLNGEGYVISSRRECQLRLAVQAHAWLEGRDSVSTEDLLLPYSATVWRTEEEIAPGQALVEEIVAPSFYKAHAGLKVARKASREFNRAGKMRNSDKFDYQAAAVQQVGKVRAVLPHILEEASSAEKPRIREIIETVKIISDELVKEVRQ